MINGLRHRQLMNRTMALLRQERKALLAADFGAFGQTSEALTDALDRLAKLPVDDPEAAREGMERIRSAAKRNQVLIEASRRGLETVKRLEAETRSARTKLSTYSGAGTTQDIAPSRVQTDRRT